MSNDYLIGVDMGTAGIKAGIFDSDGTLLSETYEESELKRPGPGRVEQDLNRIYRSAVSCIEDIVSRSKVNPRNVAAVAFSSQMSGIGAIDSEWEPAMPYDSWLDTRCEPYIFQMEKRGGGRITELTGCPPTYAHGPKILWWKEEHPDVYEMIDKFITPYAYVAGKMTGLAAEEAYIEPTTLHFTGFSDTEKEEWSDDLIREFDIDSAKLPRIVDSREIVGGLTSRAARSTGLIEGTPLVAGAGDQAAGALGAGIVEPGIAFDVAGTASVFSACVDEFRPDLDNRVVLSAPSLVEGQYYALAFINGGGMNLRWFRDEFAGERADDSEIYAILDGKAKERSPGSSGLFFLPHVQGRVCPPEPNLRGLWLGFTWGHDKASFYRSILESIAYEYAYYLDIERGLHPHLGFSEVRAIGGGSTSDFWNQLKADILGIPYRTIDRGEVGILGDAVLAGSAVGIYDDLAETAKSLVNPLDLIDPRDDHHEFYQFYVNFYQDLLEEVGGIFEDLADLPMNVNGKDNS